VFISPRAFKRYLKDVCTSLGYYGVHKIVVVNGHGGNLASLTELARELREEGIFVSVFQWWTAAPKLLPSLFTADERRHAGAEETSMNLALQEHLVNMDRAVDEVPREHAARAEGVTLPLATVDKTSSGVFGKGSTASRAKGKRLFEATVAELVRHVNSVKKMKTEDLTPKPKV
jgi:creatinine amidohydrolase